MVVETRRYWTTLNRVIAIFAVPVQKMGEVWVSTRNCSTSMHAIAGLLEAMWIVVHRSPSEVVWAANVTVNVADDS